MAEAQLVNCTHKPSQFSIDFGVGEADLNNNDLSNYRRAAGACPSDGFYAITPYTYACFGDDWHTLTEDHTTRDDGGYMLLINAARYPGEFFRSTVSRLKGNTEYEIGFWLINLCKPTKKCPSLLLPNLSVRLEIPEGKVVANFVTGNLPRVQEPRWTQHRAHFTTPASASNLILVMSDNVPSGCGNDFALDDITFRECVKQNNPVNAVSKKVPAKKQTDVSKAPPKKVTRPPQKKIQPVPVIKPIADTISKSIAVVKHPIKIFPSPPLVLKTRENALVKKIETEGGEIKIDVYDNGDIDGDTVSIYHNNVLVRSHMRLSQKPITLSININPSQSHHEIIMVAENLGSIPPNTSVMLITTPNKRYELFISSSEQKNARVVLDLKQ
ncbi:MAG: hypothetical protein V4717_04100 [Bacteroidota bacterium]